MNPAVRPYSFVGIMYAVFRNIDRDFQLKILTQHGYRIIYAARIVLHTRFQEITSVAFHGTFYLCCLRGNHYTVVAIAAKEVNGLADKL